LTRRPRAAAGVGIALAAVIGFTLYLRQSSTVAVGSDGASVALQAWDMLHRNLLLHGWAMSDVSFYSTELPQYMLLELLRGLSPDVVHLGGAMTYTILVLLAGLVAKGEATGRRGVVAALIASGIMLAPAPGFGASLLLLTPDHLGSAVPVLLAWLVVDRCPRQWYVPVAVGLLLAWGMVADVLVEVTGAVPIVVVGLVRACQRALGPRHRQVQEGAWFELSLAGAALAAIGVATLVSDGIRAAGGFVVRPVGTRFAGFAEIPHNVRLAVEGIGVLFGASFVRGQPVNLILSSLHLVGVAAALVAVGVALWRFFRLEELLVPALALAIVLNVALYVRSRYVQDVLSSREIIAVLPFGAVLAGRVLAGPLARARIGGIDGPAPALSAVLAGYLAALGLYSARPPVPAQNQALAGWLVAHHLTEGLATSYWLANIVTVDSGGRAKLRQASIQHGRLNAPDSWGFDRQWYDPAANDADFVVTDAARGSAAWTAALDSARASFGRPASTYSYERYTILVWGQNLLPRLG
jgi:hypothetical protein